MDFAAIQTAIDAEEGTSVSFGCFPNHEGERFYSVSALLRDGSHRYGSGRTLAAAYSAYLVATPVLPAKAA
jgi:hypothetical protein